MTSQTWDIAIVGAGTAGLPAAIAAGRKGAKVILIEAADTIGGTLHLSSGSFSSGGSKAQAAFGIKDSAERHYVDCVKLGHGSADDDILRLWVENAPTMTDWLVELGVDIGPDGPKLNPGHELYDVPRTFNMPGGAISSIPVFKEALQPLIDEGTVELRLSTRMTDLTTDEGRAVTGLKVEGPDGAEDISASKVVLTTGGYTQSPEMWNELHEGVPHRVHSYPHSLGDGLKVARDLGATVDHTHNFLPTFGASRDIDNPGTHWIHSRVAPSYRAPWEICVNQRGERFLSEDNGSPDDRERALLKQPDQAFWVVYDERIARIAPPLFIWDEEKVARGFAESDDFQSADTLAELAGKCGMPAETLERTVKDYNAGVSVNSDLFGRKHLPAQITQAPFYAIRHTSTSVVTWGGLKVDKSLRVLRADGSPIPNLYAGGEILGMGVFGHTFLGGSTLSASLTFGLILGEQLSD